MHSAQNSPLTDFNKIFFFLIRRWGIISIVLITGVSVVLANVLMLPPLYTATTEIVLVPNNNNIMSGSKSYGSVALDAAAIGSQIRIIKSADIAKRVIDELQLREDPELTNRVERYAFVRPLKDYLYRLLDYSPEHWSNTNKSNTRDLVKRFSESLKVDRLGKTYVIAISYTSNDPIKAARIANRIADAYIVNRFESRFALKKQMGRWLGERVKALLSKKQVSERAVREYIRKNNLFQVNGKVAYEAELEALNEKLILARGELSERHTLFRQIQDVVKVNGRLSSVGALSKSDEIKKLRNVRARLAQEEAELSSLYTKQHPRMIGKLKERKDLERQIEAEARKIAGNIKDEFEAAGKKVLLIQKELKQLQKRTEGQRLALLHVEELKREAEADRTIYESFLTRYKNISQQETLQTADAEIITTALPSKIPSSPNKKRALFLAFFGFLALGVGISYLIEALSNTLKTPDDLKQVDRAGYLAALPRLRSSDLSHEGQKIPPERYAVMKPLSPFSEALRSIRIALELDRDADSGQVLLFASAQENAGKSLICANFAQQCAATGLRTLLIDTDLRNPTLTRKMGCSHNEALVDVLSGNIQVNAAIHRDHTGLDIISGERAAMNSAELLSSEAMRGFLQKMREEYDLVILDSPPVVPVADARILARLSDQIVVIAEWNRTPVNALEHMIEEMAGQKAKIAGVLLNKVNFKKMQNYGAFGYGQYYSKEYFRNKT